jgi:hypothetical protein
MRKEKDEQKRISPVEAQAPSGKEKKRKRISHSSQKPSRGACVPCRPGCRARYVTCCGRLPTRSYSSPASHAWPWEGGKGVFNGRRAEDASSRGSSNCSGGAYPRAPPFPSPAPPPRPALRWVRFPLRAPPPRARCSDRLRSPRRNKERGF